MCRENQFLKALHDYRCKCNRSIVIQAVDGWFLRDGMMVADFRQGGMVARVRERLKILVKTPASWLAQALSTFPDTPSGPAAFLVSTDLSTHLFLCSCRVRVWLLGVGGVSAIVVGLLTSKPANKLLSSSASEASAWTVLVLLFL